mgnify:CR=1 FL=1
MRVLVLGATGLIGSAVVRRLTADGHEVLGLSSRDGDLRVPGIAAHFIDTAYADVVVHCAARIGGIAAQKADPSAAVLDNLVMGAQVIDACAKAKSPSCSGTKLVFISSSTVYPMRIGDDGEGNPCYMTAKEDWPRIPEPLYRGVGGVKVYLESLIDFYTDSFGLQSVILRPTAGSGPGERADHVIPDLIRRALAHEDPLVVWGDPYTVRDFVYVDDVASAVAGVVTKPQLPGPFNVGSGERTTIRHLAQTILATIRGAQWVTAREDNSSVGPILYDTTKPTAIPFRAVSIERARLVLNWKPEVMLEEGIRRTVGEKKG